MASEEKKENASSRGGEHKLSVYISWTAGAAYLCIGLFLLISAELAATVLLVGIALAAFLGGVYQTIRYFETRPALHSNNYSLAVGLTLGVSAMASLIWPDALRALSMLTLGASVVSTGFVYLQTALDAKRAGVYRWHIYLIFSFVSVVIGILLFTVTGQPGVLGVLLGAEGLMVLGARLFRKKIDSTEKPESKAEPGEAVPEAADVQEAEPAAAPAPAAEPWMPEAAPQPDAEPAPEAHAAPTMDFGEEKPE